MLICPECQSKNLNSHKFCQHCGTSLTHTNCHNCGAEISLVSLKCHRCGTANAQELSALIVSETHVPQLELVNNLGTNNKSQNIKTAFFETKDRLENVERKYLDSQQRYYISSEDTREVHLTFPQEPQTSIIYARVRDKFPLKESYLDTLKKQQGELFTELGQELNKSYLSVTQYWNTIGIPTVALPYLMLQHYTPVIPIVQDTWQDENLGVLLLSDRSSWQSLTDLWSHQDTPEEEILWSLNEMLKYWNPLLNTGCLTTLLIEDNLLVDEDRSLGFQQLHFDSEDEIPDLGDLAAKWHEWLSKIPEKYTPELEQILAKVITGDLPSIQDLREEIYALVSSQQDILEKSTEEEEASLKDFCQEEATKGDLFTFDTQEIDSLFYSNDGEDQPTATLAMEIASVTDASCTDIGSQRDHNEDFFGTKTTITQEENPSKKNISVRGLYLVCDGMGGHSAGEVASAMAVETLQSYFHAYWQNEMPSEDIVQEGILLANRTIYQTNIDNNRSGHGMMGTTLVMALLQDTKIAIAHVGDSRIYRVTRTFGLEQLTQDHEVGQREINRGVDPEIAYGRPDAYQLTQALGPRDNRYIKPSIQFFEVQEDCLLLLCSDGLCDNSLLEKHWETYLKPLMSSSADVQSGLFKLIDFADRYNGHDNITGILLRIKLQPNFET